MKNHQSRWNKANYPETWSLDDEGIIYNEGDTALLDTGLAVRWDGNPNLGIEVLP